jgi:hypothetical protein
MLDYYNELEKRRYMNETSNMKTQTWKYKASDEQKTFLRDRRLGSRSSSLVLALAG